MLLRVEDLVVDFHLEAGRLTAVNGVSFQIDRGETFGIVGESGSGKSVTALTIMGLLSDPGRVRQGAIWLENRNLVTLSERQWGRVRGRRMAMIFQEPMTSLNPVLTIGEQIAEVYVQHFGVSWEEGTKRAVEMLARVRIPDPKNAVNRYPHEYSGGMRQRALIAAALSCQPDLLIADEPTTALDVTIQAQILRLLQEIQADMGMGLIFISHNLGVIAQICERLSVMYAGEMVEEGTTEEVLRSPQHPYTHGLLGSIPRRGRKLERIRGSICDMMVPPPGCRFHPRCPKAQDVCKEVEPQLRSLKGGRVACHFPMDVQRKEKEEVGV